MRSQNSSSEMRLKENLLEVIEIHEDDDDCSITESIAESSVSRYTSSVP